MTDAIRGITGTGPSDGVNSAAGAKTNQTTANATPATGTAGSDLADVSQIQSLLETINATAGAVPSVDQSRVASVREAIANGSYSVDPQQIAKGLLDSDQGLPGAAPTTE